MKKKVKMGNTESAMTKTDAVYEDDFLSSSFCSSSSSSYSYNHSVISSWSYCGQEIVMYRDGYMLVDNDNAKKMCFQSGMKLTDLMSTCVPFTSSQMCLYQDGVVFVCTKEPVPFEAYVHQLDKWYRPHKFFLTQHYLFVILSVDLYPYWILCVYVRRVRQNLCCAHIKELFYKFTIDTCDRDGAMCDEFVFGLVPEHDHDDRFGNVIVSDTACTLQYETILKGKRVIKTISLPQKPT